MSEEKFDNLHENAEGQNETPENKELTNEKQEVVSQNTEETEEEKAEVAEEKSEATAESKSDEAQDDHHEDDEDEDSDDHDIDESEEKVEIEIENYEKFTLDELLEKSIHLTTNYSVQHIKKHLDLIRRSVFDKFNEEKHQKLEEFLNEGGNELDFTYENYAKSQFDKIYHSFRTSFDKYKKQLDSQLENNYAKKAELIEELKNLINKEEKMSETYKEFKDIKENWKNIGQVPKAKSGDLYRNFHHHLENFYDYLRLNNEMRDLDFKHNLEVKMKIVERAEELAKSDSIKAAFDELQDLHKIWKEETGPVAKEFREEVWNRFSEATKVIHEKRNNFQKELKDQWEKNYELKVEVCKKIEEITANAKQNHGNWQNSIKEVEKLKGEFQKIGKVPRRMNNQIWDNFKEVTRAFNRKKNEFYKDLKKDQLVNLEEKKRLVELAESLKDSEDWKATTDILKKIQSDWKKIGHVPKQHSDEVWNKFRNACNHFFDRLSDHNKGRENQLFENLEAKQAILEDLKTIKLDDDNSKALEQLMAVINKWKEAGKIPRSKSEIDKEFNSILDKLFEKLNLDKAETEFIKFKNKIDTFLESNEMKKVYQERDLIRRKMDEIRKNISQLDNNLGFFNVDENSPLVKDVKKKMAKHKDELKTWKKKLDYLRSK